MSAPAVGAMSTTTSTAAVYRSPSTGVTTVTGDELAGDYARWAAAPAGAREVATAPVEVLFRALLDLND